uniref:NADH-ubiquinone oxidoreductase chain 2 n=1 Tax=Ixodes hexagonus TaxID=34612 RepID=O99805_IXOHE|nr:NADH dehydrogenase subunit 2 [Ixodes hexagonus]AAD05504.1 NADH dehydrogenase 2 [Ixodes hexagonus]
MIFMWILTISILMALSSSFWFALWMSLEINMMIFIPITNSKNFLSSNSMVLYYIIQSLASSLFFFSSLMSTISMTMTFNLIIMITMLIKLAAAPFHSWFPQISEGMNFSSFFILSSFQKIIPLYILSFINNHMLIPFIILSSMVGSLGGLSQTSFKKILAFSSISHPSWIMCLIMINQNFWLVYFSIYTIILIMIITWLKNNNSPLIINSNSMKLSFFNKILLFSFFLSLGGLPPFLGFLAKWVAIILISKKLPLVLLVLIISSLLNLFFYMRTLFPMILNLNTLMKTPSLIHSYQSLFLFIINSLSIITLIPWILSL